MRRQAASMAGAALLASLLAWGSTAARAGETSRELAVCADPSNLPFSNERLEGFENRIASLIAEELHASVRYTWNVQRRSFLRRTLLANACDLVLGVPAGLKGVLQTRPYYRSSYVFVTAADRHLHLQGFDDPALRTLKVGLHALGAEGANTPPASALSSRGLSGNVHGYPMWSQEEVESAPAQVIDAVAGGEIDTAIVWGPFAGYFAKRYPDRLEIVPVTADPAMPSMAFVYDMGMAVRKGEEAFRDEIQGVLDRRKSDIQAVLREYGVPLIETVSTQ